MSEDFKADPNFQRLSREMVTDTTFDAVTVATIIQHGDAEVWAQRLATFRSKGLLVLRCAGLTPDDRHAVYGFASKAYGRVEGSRSLNVSSSSGSVQMRIVDEYLTKLVQMRQGRPFSLVEVTILTGDAMLANAVIRLVRRHDAFRIDEPPKKDGDGGGRYAINLDRLPQELGGKRPRVLMDGPPDLTRAQMPSRALMLEAFTELVQAYYGTSSFTIARVKRLPWFTTHTGINTGRDVFQVVETLVGLGWLIDLTGNTLHQKSDNRSFRLAANNRIADRIAMRSGRIWGEDRCMYLVEEVINDSDLLEACSAALRSIKGENDGWFVVNRDVTEILRATFDWPPHTHHQQFVERFLVLLAATPAGSLLQTRTELSPDDGGVDVLYCRCVSTRSSEEDERMANVQGAKSSQTSRADNLSEAQIAACENALTSLLADFWNADLIKVGDLEKKAWFRNGPCMAEVQAPAFASFLIKRGYADVASNSYAEGSKDRRIKLKKRDRRVIFIAMECDATCGKEAACALIDRLRTDSDMLDKIEEVLVAATEAAAPAECFIFTDVIAKQIRKIVEPSDEVYTDEFVEYFLRRLANVQMMLDLDEYFGEGEDESYTSPVMSRFRCIKRTHTTPDELPEVSEDPPSSAEVEDDHADAEPLETLTNDPEVSNKESPDDELARLRAEYGTEEVELQRRAEEQQMRLARIEALELQIKRSRQIEFIVQEALGRIALETTDEIERAVLARTIGRRLLEHADTSAE